MYKKTCIELIKPQINMVSVLLSWVRQLQNAGVSALLSAFRGGGASQQKIRGVRPWLAQCSLTHGDTTSPPNLRVDLKFKPLGCCHRVTLEVPIQEDSMSLATDKMMSNHIILYLWLDWSCQHHTFKILACSPHHQSCRQSSGKSSSILVIWREIIDKTYRCSLDIGHKHYTTSWKS